jgi:eukaryotic-like serine/threonine-protein kinase
MVGSNRQPHGGGSDDDSRQQAFGNESHTTQHVSGPGSTQPARIGPFRILTLIGEGAMGMVYEAEQERPQRRVALKIVRPGIVPADVLRRFELEYEFLGRLHHPGIAQIYQAGVEDTAYGPQPYFAMELVRGKRLDEYVRAKAPSLRERLLLVAAIADAIQHAHHRGIIHRDLKPANILVTDAGEPKVLDFGIARAAHDGLLTTVQTAVGEVLGTISYMSPEQIAGDLSGLDTRSDVYALGVILYEVLAERPPYELDRKSFAEAARVIYEEEPTRLRSATGAVPADVETIVAKALEKEKERRYTSASELADDIRRFLRDEPITARPPSAAYQVRKYARRHKAIVAGVLACVIALLFGVVATSWQAIRALRAERVAQARALEAEEEKAKAEAVTSFLTEMLASVDPSQARGRDVSVREALDAAAARIESGAMAKQPAVEIAVRNAIGTTYGSLGVFDAAERQLRAAIDLESRSGAGALVRGETHARLVNVLYGAGKHADGVQAAREALRLRREALGASHPDVASSLDDLGAMLMASGDAGGAEPLMRESIAIRRKVLPADDPQLAVGLNNLAYVTWRKGNLQEAESMYREALGIDRRRLGNDHPEVPTKLINLAVVLRDQGRPDAAEPLAREAVAIRRKILGDQHPELANALDTLSGVLEDRGQIAEAEVLLREALSIAQRTYGELNLHTARLQHNLGWVLWKKGAYAEAEPHLRTAVVNIPKTYGPTYRGARLATSNLAHDLNGLGDFRAAESTAREALASYRKAPTDRAVVGALIALSHALIAQRRANDAVPYLGEALEVVHKQPPVRFPWFKGEIQSTLGSALAAQGKPTEAEPLLLAGYEGLRDLPSTPPPRLRVALERLVAFYAANGRSAEAAAWRNRLHGFDSSRRAAMAAAARRPG